MACKSLCYPCPYDHRFVPKMIGVHCNKILSQGQLFTHNGYNLTYIALIQKELSFGQLFLYITPHFLSWCGTHSVCHYLFICCLFSVSYIVFILILVHYWFIFTFALSLRFLLLHKMHV